MKTTNLLIIFMFVIYFVTNTYSLGLTSKVKLQVQDSVIQCLKLQRSYPELNLNCEDLVNKEVKKENAKEETEKLLNEENLKTIENIDDILMTIDNKVNEVKREITKLKLRLKQNIKKEENKESSIRFREKTNELNETSNNVNKISKENKEIVNQNYLLSKLKKRNLMSTRNINVNVKSIQDLNLNTKDINTNKNNNNDSNNKLKTKSYNDLKLDINKFNNHKRDLKEVGREKLKEVKEIVKEDKEDKDVLNDISGDILKGLDINNTEELNNIVKKLINSQLKNKVNGSQSQKHHNTDNKNTNNKLNKKQVVMPIVQKLPAKPMNSMITETTTTKEMSNNSLLEAINQISSQQINVGILKQENQENKQQSSLMTNANKSNNTNNSNSKLKAENNNNDSSSKDKESTKETLSELLSQTANNDDLYNEIADQLKQLGTIKINNKK